MDIIASRYGWTNRYIEEELYWEEVWKLVVMAANFTAEEYNSEFRFQFMLHADEKAASKWKDLPIPFPETGKTPREAVVDEGGVSQLRILAPHIPISKLPSKTIAKKPQKRGKAATETKRR